jgi:hypothetical protein
VLKELNTTQWRPMGGCMYRSIFYLTSALTEGEWSASRPGRFIPVERALGTHWIGSWVDTRAGLDDLERRKFLTLLGLELRPLSRPDSSQSLYRLSYSGSVGSLVCQICIYHLDVRFWKVWSWRMLTFGMWLRVVRQKYTDAPMESTTTDFSKERKVK